MFYDSHFTYFIAWVNGLYRCCCQGIMNHQTFYFNITNESSGNTGKSFMKYCTMFIFTLICFYWIIIEDIFRDVINMKSFQRKACQRNFRLNIFKTALLFFLKFGHIYWLLSCFIKISSFFCFHYSVCALSSL
jgi:hypothetical protein